MFARLCIFILTIFLSCIAFAGDNSGTVSTRDITSNIAKVTYFYAQDRESLPHKDVAQLCKNIIKNRKNYTTDIIAKVYILLANIALNQGDSARALQFANDGLTLNSIPPSLALDLNTKVVSGYFDKGKFHKVFEITDKIYTLAKKERNTKYEMLSLGYRAMAFALIGKPQKAMEDLNLVHQIISQNQQYSEHLELLEILAISHYYLNDFQVAIDMQEKLLKLRFDLQKTNDIERTYYNLAAAYQKLSRFDDAYTAYWEAKNIALNKSMPIKIAYAELGLGQVLFNQRKFQAAYDSLIVAEHLFKGQNLTKPYLSTLVTLAAVTSKLNQDSFSFDLLKKAERLAENIELTDEQIVLYEMIAQYHHKNKNHQLAYLALTQYVEEARRLNIDFNYLLLNELFVKNKKEENKNLALQVAETSELSADYASKYAKKNTQIFFLIIACIVLFSIIVVLWFRQRSKKLKFAYEEIEKPAYIIANPTQTKIMYQRAYKKARKYQYAISIGYISIENWNELTYRFNKKITNEVEKSIAQLINENLSEFDHAGMINSGEYLIIYPHQESKEGLEKLEIIVNALKVRFFANLGEFSVNIKSSVATPSIQDIDPYIFLSRLSEANTH